MSIKLISLIVLIKLIQNILENSAKSLFRTQLVSEEDSPTKMSDARWNSFFLAEMKPVDQMGRQGVGSTRSRSSEEGTPCSHPSTPAGKHLATSCSI